MGRGAGRGRQRFRLRSRRRNGDEHEDISDLEDGFDEWDDEDSDEEEDGGGGGGSRRRLSSAVLASKRKVMAAASLFAGIGGERRRRSRSRSSTGGVEWDLEDDDKEDSKEEVRGNGAVRGSRPRRSAEDEDEELDANLKTLTGKFYLDADTAYDKRKRSSSKDSKNLLRDELEIPPLHADGMLVDALGGTVGDSGNGRYGEDDHANNAAAATFRPELFLPDDAALSDSSPFTFHASEIDTNHDDLEPLHDYDDEKTAGILMEPTSTNAFNDQNDLQKERWWSLKPRSPHRQTQTRKSLSPRQRMGKSLAKLSENTRRRGASHDPQTEHSTTSHSGDDGSSTSARSGPPSPFRLRLGPPGSIRRPLNLETNFDGAATDTTAGTTSTSQSTMDDTLSSPTANSEGVVLRNYASLLRRKQQQAEAAATRARRASAESYGAFACPSLLLTVSSSHDEHDTEADEEHFHQIVKDISMDRDQDRDTQGLDQAHIGSNFEGNFGDVRQLGKGPSFRRLSSAATENDSMNRMSLWSSTSNGTILKSTCDSYLIEFDDEDEETALLRRRVDEPSTPPSMTLPFRAHTHRSPTVTPLKDKQSDTHKSLSKKLLSSRLALDLFLTDTASLCAVVFSVVIYHLADSTVATAQSLLCLLLAPYLPIQRRQIRTKNDLLMAQEKMRKDADRLQRFNTHLRSKTVGLQFKAARARNVHEQLTSVSRFYRRSVEEVLAMTKELHYNVVQIVKRLQGEILMLITKTILVTSRRNKTVGLNKFGVEIISARLKHIPYVTFHSDRFLRIVHESEQQNSTVAMLRTFRNLLTNDDPEERIVTILFSPH